MKLQRGNTLVGVVIGLVLGLGAALAVAVYVTKVPIPFMNKTQTRTPEQDAAESKKNQNWDPNAPLYGKNPAKPAAPASAPEGAAPVPAPSAAPAAPAVPAPAAATPVPAAPAAKSADPLGDLAAARAGAAAPAEPEGPGIIRPPLACDARAPGLAQRVARGASRGSGGERPRSQSRRTCRRRTPRGQATAATQSTLRDRQGQSAKPQAPLP